MAWAYADKPKLLELHRRDPLAWYEQRWGGQRWSIEWSRLEAYKHKTKWDGDRDPLAKAWRSVAASNHTAVESATGIGKTYFAALITFWFLDVYRGGQVVLVGPSESHLKHHLWAEMRGMRPQFKRLYPDSIFHESPHLVVDPTDEGAGKFWGAWAKTAQKQAGATSTTGMQGTHAKDMLTIVDEAAGADMADVEALIQTSGADNNPILMLGNPDSQADALHRFALRSGTVLVRASALDHPNIVTGVEVIPGATGRKRLSQMAGEKGENIKTNFYKSRARGISPAQSDLALFRFEWFEKALDAGLQDFKPAGGDMKAAGIDVARSKDGDPAACAFGHGPRLLSLVEFPCPDASDIAYNMAYGRKHAEAKGWNIYPVPDMTFHRDLWPDQVAVDLTGVGASTVEAFNKLGHEVIGLKMAERAWADCIPQTYNKKTHTWSPIVDYGNFRAQMFFAFAEELRLGEVSFAPATRALVLESAKIACAIEEKIQGGRKFVTSKDELRASFTRSPDPLDAMAQWNWIRKDRRIRNGQKLSVS